VAVVQQTIKDRGSDHRVAEDRAPLADTAVAGKRGRASLVTAANELEEEMRGIGLKGQIPDFVDDQELWLSKLRGSLLEPAFTVTVGELRNDSRGCADWSSTTSPSMAVGPTWSRSASWLANVSIGASTATHCSSSRPLLGRNAAMRNVPASNGCSQPKRLAPEWAGPIQANSQIRPSSTSQNLCVEVLV
jgi:hypothetical protein